MSKVYRKTATRGHWSVLCASALVILGAIVALAGCGQLSLTQLLENEEPGELGLSPSSARIQVDTAVTIQGKGGFRPYTYGMVEGVGEGGGTIDPATGVFDATAEGEVILEVTDHIGSKAQGTFEIIRPVQLLYAGEAVSHLTVALADLPLLFDAVDGFPPYVFQVEGEGGSIDPIDDDTCELNAGETGEYQIQVVDERENSSFAIVRIVDPGGPLTVNPEVAYVELVEPDRTVEFTVYNYIPFPDPDPPLAVTVEPPGAGTIIGIAEDGNEATVAYEAPEFETVVTVRLTDALASVTAIVHVIDDLKQLWISPLWVGGVEYGDTIIFTAYGGIEPYSFWVEHDDVVVDRIEVIAPNQAVYTAPSFRTTDWVWLEDALGDTRRVRVKVRRYAEDSEDDD
jgi:hypothetical protein